jgi:poly(beta-D-mannuronate) lyase
MKMPSAPALAVASLLLISGLRAESAYRLIAPSDLAALSARFEPGDVVLLPDATWEHQTLTFKGRGTPEKPITLKATNPGKFVLTGRSSLTIDGEWLVVESITLKDAGIPEAEGIALKGTNNRLTASVVEGSTHKFAVRLHGTRHRVDHCYFANKTSGEPTLQVEVDAAMPNDHRIDHNHFGYRAPLGRNGGETIRVGYSYQSMSVSRTIVERNLFERCDGEIEIISSKSCENIYRGNTFRDCDGMLTLRHGNRNIVDANFFFGGRKPNSGGIRIIGEDHVVTNNYIEGVMKGAFWITSGVPDSALNQYFVAKRALIAFNTVVDSAGPCFDLSAGLGTAGRTLKPEEITIANNLVSAQTGAIVAGEEGARWQWLGNWTDVAGTAREPRFRAGTLHLQRAADGLLRPGPQSAARGAAEGAFPRVNTDIDGQRRTSPTDIGCDHHASTAPLQRPLTPGDVGPRWRSR